MNETNAQEASAEVWALRSATEAAEQRLEAAARAEWERFRIPARSSDEVFEFYKTIGKSGLRRVDVEYTDFTLREEALRQSLPAGAMIVYIDVSTTGQMKTIYSEAIWFRAPQPETAPSE